VIVRDNSPGLPIDHLEEMVTPGWTTETTETPAAVAWAWRWSAHAVTRMGGTISAANDGGAVFHIYLAS
jgi:C4-dicarboxylate-specific signal transduction histidine kinase